MISNGGRQVHIEQIISEADFAKKHVIYTGTIKYLEQIFTIVPHITAGRRC